MCCSFDVLYAEGVAAPKMMSVGLHCRLAGRPGRAAALARFLDYVQQHEDVWIARRVDIARHWLRQFPAYALAEAHGMQLGQWARTRYDPKAFAEFLGAKGLSHSFRAFQAE